MTTLRQSEPSANNALCSLLRAAMPGCRVHSEITQSIQGFPGRHPDVLVTASGRSPVIIEAEVEPGYQVEKEAGDRLGLQLTTLGRPIEAAIALRYPQSVRDAYDLGLELADGRLSYCVFTIERYGPPPERNIETVARFPESGWLEGSVSDLADMVRLVSVPRLAVEDASEQLQNGINLAAGVLEELEESRPAINGNIARLLGLANVPATRRMAGAIIANALVFHQRIAGMHQDVAPLHLVCGPGVSQPMQKTLAVWNHIIRNINYYPIFAIATDILGQLTDDEGDRILRNLQVIAGHVGAAGVDSAHDLTGRVFQRLIVDRKYLATFYTLPSSAALLARLAVAKLEGMDWSDADSIGQLRVADFACGTGALLSAVYEQLAGRHQRAGGDPAGLHRQLMAEVLYGCDVMPSAVHISGATLAGHQPNVGYHQSRIYTLPYGRQPDNSVKIGSLELLQTSAVMTLFNTSDPALRTGSVGEETAGQLTAEFPDDDYDLVIMNPPFTRAGSDWEGGGRDEDAIKQFRGLSTDLETQKEMAAKEKQLGRNTCSHGYAGIASSFAALAHRKLKRGGVLALVMPLSAAAGMSWRKFRQMLMTQYTDIMVLSNVASGWDMSFSSDTGMGECLIVARKLKKGETSAKQVSFVSLSRRPPNLAYAAEAAKSILDSTNIRQLDDGPYDGTPLLIGGELAGKELIADSSTDGAAWPGTRISDFALAQTAHALAGSRLWLPGASDALPLKVAPLSIIDHRGLYHRNIASTLASAPFVKAQPSRTATYPALWNHDARKETRMVCLPDFQLQVKPGLEARANEVWATASRIHFNLDFRFNSQPLTTAFTEQKSIGGTAWPNIAFPDDKFDYACSLWCNSTLGLLAFWWYANRQQAGRGRTTISAIETLPLLDFRSLTDEQLAKAEAIFEEFRDKELLPAYLADADPNRALLDRRVICDLLGFDQSVYQGVRRLAQKWCAEPSVHGGKARPRNL